MSLICVTKSQKVPWKLLYETKNSSKNAGVSIKEAHFFLGPDYHLDHHHNLMNCSEYHMQTFVKKK